MVSKFNLKNVYFMLNILKALIKKYNVCKCHCNFYLPLVKNTQQKTAPRQKRASIFDPKPFDLLEFVETYKKKDFRLVIF